MNITTFIDFMNKGTYENIPLGILDVRNKVAGFSTPILVNIINMAVASLEKDELYLEMGVMAGRTLIGALINNSALAVGVDNFSQFSESPAISMATVNRNLEQFHVDGRVSFYQDDCQVFLHTYKTLYLNKIGVYFYDGNHDTDQGLAGLESALDMLADNAVIIVDDLAGPGVWRSVVQFVSNHIEETEIIFAMSSANFPFGDPRWHNGIIVLAYRRKGKQLEFAGDGVWHF